MVWNLLVKGFNGNQNNNQDDDGTRHSVDTVHRGNNSRNNNSSSRLMQYIRAENWGEALKWVRDHPEEASWQVREVVSLDDGDDEGVRGSGGGERTKFYHPIHAVCVHAGRQVTASAAVSLDALVLALIEVCPECVREVDHSGRLPLHIVCWKAGSTSITTGDECSSTLTEGTVGVDCNVIMAALIGNYAAGVKVQDCHGSTCLHLACQFQLNLDYIRMLVYACPEAKDVKDSAGCLPMKYASSCFDDKSEKRNELLNLVKPSNKLLEKDIRESAAGGNPDSLNVGTSENTQSRVQQLANKFNGVSPQSSPRNGSDVIVEGHTVLYSFIVERCWEDVIGRCKEYKSDARTWYIEKSSNRTKVRILPLHRACEMNGVPVEAISALINAFPGSLKAKDHSGRLALHTACWKGASYSVVECLIDNYAGGLNVEDHHGSLPLHISCQFGSSSDIVNLLRVKSPETVSKEDNLGRTALDIVNYHSNPNKFAIMHILAPQQSVPYDSTKNLMGADKRQANTFPLSPDNVVTGDTELYRLIDAKNWDQANNRCLDFPGEASIWFKESSRRGGLHAQLLPLHLACLLRPPVSLVNTLINAHAKAVMSRDHSGRLPIHNASWKNSSPEVVRILMESNQACVLQKDHRGRLPLHVACEFGASEKLVKVLVLAGPDSIFERDSLQRTALDITSYNYFYNKHRIMNVLETGIWSTNTVSFENSKSFEGQIKVTESTLDGLSLFRIVKNKKWDMIDARILSHPKETRRWIEKRSATGKIEWKLLPIHRLCELKPPLEAVKSLCQAYPQSLMLPDHGGRLPLHSACKRKCSYEVIDYLISVDKRSVMCKDKRERLPIHVALEYGVSKTVVEKLLLVAPETAGHREKEGKFPMHIACSSRNMDKAIIFQIFWCYQGALIQPDYKGNLPIDYAKGSRSESRSEVITMLRRFKSDYFPDATHFNDSSISQDRNVSWDHRVSTYDYDATPHTVFDDRDDGIAFGEEAPMKRSNTFDAHSSRDYSKNNKEKRKKGKKRFGNGFGRHASSLRRVSSGPM